jgi:glutathione synthase/RimK-type ligase-like ATP-grasp enzyme
LEKQYIGILLSSQLYRDLEHGKQPQILSFYEDAGKLNNIIPVYLLLNDIQPGEPEITGYVMNLQGEYQKSYIPKPCVIHNRGYHCSKAAKKQIKRLQAEGIIFFNEWNQYGKYKIHKFLAESEDIQPHLPETVLMDQKNLIDMMKKHRELIIKPSSGTFGKRNMKATRLNDTEWLLSYPIKGIWVEELVLEEQLPAKIERLITKGKYLIQERIQLAEYHNNPFDMRVSVQRNGNGEWQVTGIVGKVAKQGSFITNVARGGTCFTIDEIIRNVPHLDKEQLTADVKHFALKIAEQLSTRMANLADIGLDVGITMDGIPMFIECNARDLRFAFREALLFDTWRETYITPISYGKYLITKREGH